VAVQCWFSRLKVQWRERLWWVSYWSMTRLLVGGGAKVVTCRREADMRRKRRKRRKRKRAWHHWWLWFQKTNWGRKGAAGLGSAEKREKQIKSLGFLFVSHSEGESWSVRSGWLRGKGRKGNWSCLFSFMFFLGRK